MRKAAVAMILIASLVGTAPVFSSDLLLSMIAAERGDRIGTDGQCLIVLPENVSPTFPDSNSRAPLPITANLAGALQQIGYRGDTGAKSSALTNNLASALDQFGYGRNEVPSTVTIDRAPIMLAKMAEPTNVSDARQGPALSRSGRDEHHSQAALPVSPQMAGMLKSLGYSW